MVFENLAVLPPEIISGQMYSGPGAEPLLAAAAAWAGLGAELHSAATAYASVLSGLTARWLGSSSVAMAAAAAPHVAWMSTTATQAEETAAQAGAAAGAYEAAFAAVVPPPVIAANRSQLAALVASNILGQNSTAIAANEAEYAGLWAQDVAAMLGYASSSAAATRLTPFSAPRQTTAATARSAAAPNTPTGNPDMKALYESFYNLQSALGSEGTWTNAAGGTANLGMTQVRLFHKLPTPAAIPKSALGGGLSSLGLLPSSAARIGGGLAAGAAASSGTAATVGALSVPPGWVATAPAVKLASVALPNAALAAAPAAGLPGGMLSPAMLGSLTGGALGGPAARVATPGVKIVAADTRDRNAPVKLDQVIAQLQQTPDVVQHWNVDEAGLDDLVAKLSLKPGIHAVHVCADGDTAVG